MEKSRAYDPYIELNKGATLTVESYDKTQKIAVNSGKVAVGGKPGIVEISGLATGRQEAGINGCLGLWLSLFRYMRPDGTTDHVPGWNIMLPLTAGQTPVQSAVDFAACLNAGTRPYRAAVTGDNTAATLIIVFTAK